MTDEIRDQLQETLGTAYTLERELGGGGMSRVFVAEDTTLQRKVVVKVLPPELTAGVNVERFNREILVAAKLQHPHIVPVLSAGVTNGLPFYTMPFVEGRSLRTRLAAPPLAIGETVGILRDVAKALAYAHGRGIVHRDIKPDNVLLTGGSATVTDFGIAKAISASRSGGGAETLTQIGTSIGTPAYMSPEQAAGDPATDHRADIYSFGCMAYELLAGRPPFVDASPRRLLAAHMGETPPPVIALRPDTPPDLATLVMRCLEKEPDGRPQSASDLVAAIESVSSGGDQPVMPLVLLGGRALFRRALAAYAIAFVAVAVFAKAAIVGIGLPDWVFPGALIVMALGLPIVLWTGYVSRVAHRAMTATPTFTPGGSPSMQRGTMATLAMKASPHVSWRRTARGGVLAMTAFVLLVAAVMTMRALGIGPFGSLMAAGTLKAREPILLDDFSVVSGDSALGRVVSDAVRAGLNESSVISLMAPAEIGGALERMQLSPASHITAAVARQIAQREGVKAIADGEVTQIGTSYIVAVRLITADSGKELVSYRASAKDAAGLIAASDELSRKLRAKVGESLRRVQSAPPLAQVTTSSLEALRLYGDGYRAMLVEGDDEMGERLLRRAIAVDSTFGAAWRALAAAMSNLGRSPTAVDSIADRAYALRDRMTERERDYAVGEYYRNGSGLDRAKSLEAYERMLARGDSSALNNIALVYHSRRQYVRAETLWIRGLRRNPNLRRYSANLIAFARVAGDFHFSDSVFAAVPPSMRPSAYEFSRLYDRGELDAMATLADSAARSRTPIGRRGRTSAEAIVALARGRLASWRQTLGGRLSVNGAIDLATAHVPLDGAVAALDSVLARSPLSAVPKYDRRDLEFARAYALAHRPDRARAILAQYDREIADTALKRSQQPELHSALAAIAVAEKLWPTAITETRKADSLPDGPASSCSYCLPIALFWVFAEAGMTDSALAQYEIYKQSPWGRRELRGPDLVIGAAGYEQLGRLYEAKGDPAKAAESYRGFIELWKNADPELQPRVADARRRVSALIKLEQPPRR